MKGHDRAEQVVAQRRLVVGVEALEVGRLGHVLVESQPVPRPQAELIAGVQGLDELDEPGRRPRRCLRVLRACTPLGIEAQLVGQLQIAFDGIEAIPRDLDLPAIRLVHGYQSGARRGSARA